MYDDRPSDTDISASWNSSHDRTHQDQLTPSEAHSLLADERRRLLLWYLATGSDDVVSTDELVDVVVDREEPDPGPASHRTRVETDLHHTQLPKLADAGIIAHDAVAETVEYEQSEPLEALLATSNAVEERSG